MPLFVQQIQKWITYQYIYSVKEVNLPGLELKMNIKSSGHLPPKSKCFWIFSYPHSSEDGFIAETSQLLERGGFGQEEDSNDIIGDNSEEEVRL